MAIGSFIAIAKQMKFEPGKWVELRMCLCVCVRVKKSQRLELTESARITHPHTIHFPCVVVVAAKWSALYICIFVTLYDVGDDVGNIADDMFIDAELLPPVALLCVLPPPALLLFDDFFSLRDLPLDSPPPPLCRELADDDCDGVIGLPPLLTPPIPSPPGNAAARSGCGNPGRPDACRRVK